MNTERAILMVEAWPMVPPTTSTFMPKPRRISAASSAAVPASSIGTVWPRPGTVSITATST